jgi:hypothetical protein
MAQSRGCNGHIDSRFQRSAKFETRVRPNRADAQAFEFDTPAKRRRSPLTMALIWQHFSEALTQNENHHDFTAA